MFLLYIIFLLFFFLMVRFVIRQVVKLSGRFKSAVVWSSCIMMVIVFQTGNLIFWHLYCMYDRVSEPAMVRCELKEVKKNIFRIGNDGMIKSKDSKYYVKVKPVETVPIVWRFESLPKSERMLLKIMDYSCFGLLMTEKEESNTKEHTKYVGYYGDDWLIQVSPSVYESLVGAEGNMCVDVEARCNDKSSALVFKLFSI